MIQNPKRQHGADQFTQFQASRPIHAALKALNAKWASRAARFGAAFNHAKPETTFKEEPD